MIFIDEESQSIEIKIVSYQFPTNFTNVEDANWLNIFICVHSKIGNWQVVDPALTTWEFNELILWFETLSNNQKPTYSTLTFTEPNLSFELLNGYDEEIKQIRIRLNAECKPKRFKTPVFFDFKFDANKLKTVTEELKKNLQSFPEKK
ncbi:MAG: hypothetical protein O9340_02705 [Cyclobacteriaceae bacterium]|jgi:hypothetical protein|nr:hypothetical protein [Cyclobacteriaceae bacterium]